MTTLLQQPASRAGADRLAFDGGPKTIAATPRDRWKHLRLGDVIPIAKLLRWGIATSASGDGAVGAFEQDFARLCGCRYGLAMNSGTAALHSALFAVGVGPGDEVIMPSYTWQATASAALCCGAKPVFCDIDPRTLTADPHDIEARITPRTKAILVVHIWGNPAEMDAICRIASRHSLPVVEDCSHAHGASFRGKPVGAWGDVGCFSLQGTKAVSAGEGGIAVCNDALYFDRMLALGHPVRTATGLQGDEFAIGQLCLGPKYRPHLFGILLAQRCLTRLPQLNDLRRRNWGIFCHELKGCEGIQPVGTLEGAERGGFLEFKFLMNPEIVGVDRARFVEALQAEGVPAIPDRYGRLHENCIFRNGGPLRAEMLADRSPVPPVEPPLVNTDMLLDRTITLPAYADVDESYIRQCAAAMRKVADRIGG